MERFFLKMQAKDWFKKQDYNEGVNIYAQSTGAKRKLLSTLKRGKSSRNMALLISELRKLINTEAKEVPRKKKPVKPQEKPVELERNQVKAEAAKSYFQKIRYGELPAELKLRFRKLKDVFYDMCDLKFEMNDLPDEAEGESLRIQIEIEKLDEQRSTIWKELEHWQNYKTMLPTKTEDDFSGLDAMGLLLKQASLKSSIHKMKKRLAEWKDRLEAGENKIEARKIAQQINRTEKKLHQNEINLRKVEELL